MTMNHGITKSMQNSAESENNPVVSNQNQVKETFKLREWNLSCKLYLGSLGDKADKYKIEKAVKRYGQLKNVWVAKNTPGFAFIEYEDSCTTESAFKDIYGIKSFDKSKVPKVSKYWLNQAKFQGEKANYHMNAENSRTSRESNNEIAVRISKREGNYFKESHIKYPGSQNTSRYKQHNGTAKYPNKPISRPSHHYQSKPLHRPPSCPQNKPINKPPRGH